MELGRYLEVLRRRWLIVAAALVATSAATFYLVLPQPSIYEATGSFVVGPRASSSEESLQAIDTLIRGDAINSTYASIARSDLVRARAEEELPSSIDTENMAVSAEVQTGTNILSISVQGLEPESVQKLAMTIGQKTIEYVSTLNEAYRLEPLDEPKVPKAPVGPKKFLTIAIGLTFGTMLGLTLALVVDFLALQFARGRSQPDPLPVLDGAIELLDGVGARRTADLTSGRDEPIDARGDVAGHDEAGGGDSAIRRDLRPEDWEFRLRSRASYAKPSAKETGTRTKGTSPSAPADISRIDRSAGSG